MNPLGVMIDRAIDRPRGAHGLRCANVGLNIARALGALLPFTFCAAKHLHSVDPMTGLA